MIEIQGVSKVYDDGFQALKNMNLHIQKGELITLIGPSGCGKTTMMKMINRLIEPTEGKIFVDGEDISKVNPVELRRNIGYVIQQIGLFPHMTIAENISLIPKLKNWDKQAYTKRVDELLDLVGLDPRVFRNRYPAELSGGQQQRVGVARAMAAEPPVILMDEPFSALDPLSREQLQDELVKLQDEIQKTIVFVTHDMDEAIKIAARIAIMKDGEIVQLDSPDQILRHPANDFVRNFIGEERLESMRDYMMTAQSLMMKRVVTARPTRGLAEALKMMKSSQVDSLFITDKEGYFLGVVTLDDVQRYYNQEDKMLKDLINDRLITVTTDQHVAEVAEIFARQAPSNIPVVNDGKLIGLITRSSMMRGLAGLQQESYGKEVAQ